MPRRNCQIPSYRKDFFVPTLNNRSGRMTHAHNGKLIALLGSTTIQKLLDVIKPKTVDVGVFAGIPVTHSLSLGPGSMVPPADVGHRHIDHKNKLGVFCWLEVCLGTD